MLFDVSTLNDTMLICRLIVTIKNFGKDSRQDHVRAIYWLMTDNRISISYIIKNPKKGA